MKMIPFILCLRIIEFKLSYFFHHNSEATYYLMEKLVLEKTLSYFLETYYVSFFIIL